MESVTLKVKGMTCSGCVASVTRVLQALEGVQRAEVSLTQNEARIDFEPDRLNREDLAAAIEDAGFEVSR